MEKFISTESKNSLLKIGLYQLVGGTIGVLLVIWGIIKANEINGSTVLFALLMLPFFSYSIFCGYLCLKMKHNCMMHSLINQGMQIVGFVIMGYAFKFIAGFYVTIELFLTESFSVSFGAGISKFIININSGPKAIEIDINLIALIIFVWLDNLNKKIKEERSIRSDNRFL